METVPYGMFDENTVFVGRAYMPADRVGPPHTSRPYRSGPSGRPVPTAAPDRQPQIFIGVMGLVASGRWPSYGVSPVEPGLSHSPQDCGI